MVESKSAERRERREALVGLALTLGFGTSLVAFGWVFTGPALELQGALATFSHAPGLLAAAGFLLMIVGRGGASSSRWAPPRWLGHALYLSAICLSAFTFFIPRIAGSLSGGEELRAMATAAVLAVMVVAALYGLRRSLKSA